MSSDLRIVLASRSPQREAILRQLGLPYRIVVSRFDEHDDHGADPAGLALHNARGKAREVSSREMLRHGEFVLGVDTVVALEGNLYGKATDAAQAREFLRALGGRTHHVYSGLWLVSPIGELAGVDSTSVTFRDLDAAAIDAYVDCGEWRDRAGAYAIQGVGSSLVRAVEGDYWNVVGLPVDLLVDKLGEAGVAPLSWL